MLVTAETETEVQSTGTLETTRLNITHLTI